MAATAQQKCLVTGGLGYIGSHTLVELLNAGYACHVVDNQVNSSSVSLDRVKEITGKADQLDVLDGEALDATFKEYGPFQHVLHFASLKAVGESITKPLRYYKNNVVGTVELVEAMQRHGVRNLVFSSSATVYGTSASPLTEMSQVGVGITNPYGQSKFMIENILRDCAAAPASEESQPLRVVLLRYFNPVGAHSSGRIGEDPNGPPNNLNPYILQVAVGKRSHVNVFGDKYDTADGTGERDYLHVVDLANGHVAALDWLKKQPLQEQGLCEVFNLGTGTPVSVLQAITAVGKAAGKEIPYEIQGTRSGDLACVYADAAKARSVLGWEAQRSFEDACVDGWKWQSSNPNGFKGE